jgi:hypothetical protein
MDALVGLGRLVIDRRRLIRQIIAHDCPRMREPQASIYELCGVMFPELPRWF